MLVVVLTSFAEPVFAVELLGHPDGQFVHVFVLLVVQPAPHGVEELVDGGVVVALAQREQARLLGVCGGRALEPEGLHGQELAQVLVLLDFQRFGQLLGRRF